MKKTLKDIAYISGIIVAVVLLIWIVGLFTGCSQRECNYDPNTGELHYKSNSIATDTTADYIKITTPTGVIIELNRIKQDNDGVKAITPYGVVETKGETK